MSANLSSLPATFGRLLPRTARVIAAVLCGASVGTMVGAVVGVIVGVTVVLVVDDLLVSVDLVRSGTASTPRTAPATASPQV